MADADKATIEKLKKLYEALRENEAKSYELLEEIGRVLGGEPGIGALLKEAEAAFAAAWSTRYPGRYIWRYTQDRPNIKRLLKALGLEEFSARAKHYIADPDPYYLKARHSFALFVASINSHAVIGADALELTPASDCKHTPRCQSQAVCTRRSAADLRA
jgi:hypothetical protein